MAQKRYRKRKKKNQDNGSYKAYAIDQANNLKRPKPKPKKDNPERVYHSIPQMVKDEIKRSPYTQKEIADKIGISQTNLSLIVTGKSLPGPNTLHNLLHLLNIEIYYSAKDRIEPIPVNNKPSIHSVG